MNNIVKYCPEIGLTKDREMSNKSYNKYYSLATVGEEETQPVNGRNESTDGKISTDDGKIVLTLANILMCYVHRAFLSRCVCN